jgi:hypothetical protein
LNVYVNVCIHSNRYHSRCQRVIEFTDHDLLCMHGAPINQLEERLMAKSGNLKSDVLELLRDPTRGSDTDKLRLFLVSLLCNDNLSAQEIDDMQRSLPAAVAQSPAISFLKRSRAFNTNAPLRSRPVASTSSTSASNLGFSFVQRVCVSQVQ